MRFAFSAFALLLIGCVLVVTPAEHGDRCRFQGETSQCGACVQASCQAQVDGCCGSAACAPTLRALDDCATKHDGSCGSLTTASNDLGRCIATSCAAVCAPLTGRSATKCEELRGAEACRCETTADEANDVVCSEASFAPTLCCAPIGWPAPVQECTCAPLSCSPIREGCFCSLAPRATTGSACGGSDGGTPCCAQGDTCTCRASGCFPFERPVPRCELGQVTCPEGQAEVASCSVRVTP